MGDMEEWNRDAYEASLTGQCFSFTPYDAGWDGDDGLGIDGGVLQGDGQMRRLLGLERAVGRLVQWSRRVAGQIADLPPCGWCFPQAVEGICRNIGAGDAAASRPAPAACYTVGPARLGLMADYTVCLDGWIKGAPADEVAAELVSHGCDGRDWAAVTARVWDVLGRCEGPKVLLARRLLMRLRFWLRAPYGAGRADKNFRLGYYYTHRMARYEGWDYFSYERTDLDVVELEQRIRESVDRADRWLDMIESTWPCAPKVFRYLERLVVAMGRVSEGETAPTELDVPLGRGVLGIDRTCMDSARSRMLFDSAVRALGDAVAGEFPVAETGAAEIDAEWAGRLKAMLGDAGPVKTWLTALLLKRILLFEEGFRTFHFTSGPRRVC